MTANFVVDQLSPLGLAVGRPVFLREYGNPALHSLLLAHPGDSLLCRLYAEDAAVVIATGVGSLSVLAGDLVGVPESGGTKVVVGDKEYSIFREQDLLGVFH